MFVLPQTRIVRQAQGTRRRVELAPSLAQVIDHLLDGAAPSCIRRTGAIAGTRCGRDRS